MLVADAFKFDTVSNFATLTIEATALYALAGPSVPEDVRIEAGETISKAKAKEMVKKAEQAAIEKAAAETREEAEADDRQLPAISSPPSRRAAFARCRAVGHVGPPAQWHPTIVPGGGNVPMSRHAKKRPFCLAHARNAKSCGCAISTAPSRQRSRCAICADVHPMIRDGSSTGIFKRPRRAHTSRSTPPRSPPAAFGSPCHAAPRRAPYTAFRPSPAGAAQAIAASSACAQFSWHPPPPRAASPAVQPVPSPAEPAASPPSPPARGSHPLHDWYVRASYRGWIARFSSSPRLPAVALPPCRRCQWPAWADGKAPNRWAPRFCDAPSVAGRSWCAEHAALAVEERRGPLPRTPVSAAASGPEARPDHLGPCGLRMLSR